jgi:hypothetical protein
MSFQLVVMGDKTPTTQTAAQASKLSPLSEDEGQGAPPVGPSKHEFTRDGGHPWLPAGGRSWVGHVSSTSMI